MDAMAHLGVAPTHGIICKCQAVVQIRSKPIKIAIGSGSCITCAGILPGGQVLLRSDPFEIGDTSVKNVYSMTCIAPTVSAILGLPMPSGTAGTPIPEIVADLRPSERAAIVATDAFGEFAWSLWQDEMPYMQSLRAQRTLTLRSVLPSITPVNFATMVTGTDLDGHGVRTYNHDFECETLFDVVRSQGGQSAGIGIDGYTGSKLLARFADIGGIAQDKSDDAVAARMIDIVIAQQPKFLIAQLGIVDTVFHAHGPSSPEVVPMLRGTDARLKRLVEFLKPHGYAVIILSDHGQHDIPDPEPGGLRGGHGTDSDRDCLVPCVWI